VDADANGGNGGNGGFGGIGGLGGQGALGGGGAGGTVKLYGTIVDADNTLVRTTGGFGVSNGGNGRTILGSNVAGSGPATTGSNVSSFTGTRGDNPFVKGVDDTAFIADLVGGAELFGLLNGIDANDAAFAAVNMGKPANALGAILRLDLGPTGYADDYAGFDMLLFLNLTADALIDPMLGFDPLANDPAFRQSLLSGGFATQAAFGGSGPAVLGSLGGFGVYATLVSEGAGFFNASAVGATSVSGELLGDGDFAYLLRAQSVPEASALGLFGLALAGLGLVARRRKTG
jgi:hypothetical protein